ncbi:MAG: hypothetical protein VX498_08090 [Myxococcota bacterium]|nr:hypothetical protein [Myxococcota bacterium]
MTSDPPSPRRPLARWALPGLVLLGLALQASRLPFRWNQISIGYASYFKEYRHVISVEGWTAAFSTFVGLHPPAYALIFLGMVSSAVPPIVWHTVSGLFAVASIPVLFWAARRNWSASLAPALVAAAVIAVSPHRNAYGLEVNNYPLFLLTSSIQWASFAALVMTPAEGRRERFLTLAWALATAAALWSHVLAFALPLSQAIVLLVHAQGRRHLRRLLTGGVAAGLLCLPLLGGLLAGGEANPINNPAGLQGALKSMFLDFPGRYGSRLGALLVGVCLLLGAVRTFQQAPRQRLLPLACLAHLLLGGSLILFMVARGIAAAHQFPYYLALVPSAALLVGAAVAGPTRLDGKRDYGTVLATIVLIAGLTLHGLVLGTDALRGKASWNSASQDRALMALAVEEWTAGSTLILVDFPGWNDDDKDVLDPTWALVPITERVHFAHPEVPQLVTADPYWGQPVRFGVDRWLYTFTGWPSCDCAPSIPLSELDPDGDGHIDCSHPGCTERLDAIADHVLGRGQKLIVAVYNTELAYGDFEKAETWAMRRGNLGRSAPSQALWVLTPDAR